MASGSARGRRRRHEEHDNHERWLVSYADFITLLFAFFVVMYAISSVNDGKYRVLSSSLEQAFSKTKRDEQPVRVDELLRSPNEPNKSPVETSTGGSDSAIDLGGRGNSIVDGNEPPQNEAKDNATIMHELNEALQPLIDSDQITLRETDQGVEVELKSNVLFGSGRAELTRNAGPLLKQISKQLLEFNNDISIQGYTDNQPISNPMYASNWELSAARAAVVANLLNRQRVHADRLTAVGFGENQPIGDNKTAEGRQKNRRVVMLIASARTGSAGRTGSTAGTRVSSAAVPAPVDKPWEKIAIEGPAAKAKPVPAEDSDPGEPGNVKARVNRPR